NKVNWFEVVLANLPHIPMSSYRRPMPFEDASGEVLDLHLPPNLHPGPFEAEVDSTDPGEQATNRKHIPTSRIHVLLPPELHLAVDRLPPPFSPRPAPPRPNAHPSKLRWRT